ncbi:MAG: sensor histidine kinase [Bacteroidetes bacterium]|nr:sensor histidine kinase [Bacteroidota bacterium]
MIKRVFIQIICLLIISACSYAQALNKDSLLKSLPSAKEDTNKVKLYYTLADYYYKEDLKESEKYCYLGKELSQKLKYTDGVLGFYTLYSNILNIKGSFDSTLIIDLEALNYAKQNADSTEVGRTMLNVGMAYRQLEDYENAVGYIEAARDILNRNNAHQYEGATYNFLQYLYYSMHQYRKGANNGLNAVNILEKTNDKNTLQQAYNNLGLNYIELQQYDSAKYYLNKAVKLAEESGEKQILITTSLNYALISLKQQQVDSIKIYADKALSLARIYNAHEYEGLAQYGLAYHYLLKKDYANAKLMADSAMALANEYNLRDVKQKIYALQSSLYYAMQNTQLGYYYFNQYELLNDSLLNESITKNTIHIEKKFETAKKEAQIKLQQSQIRQKNNQIYFLITGALALLLISLLGYFNFRNRRKLQQTKIDELEKEKQLTATEAVLKGEEQERTRLAKDLHDGLGGMLSGIKHSLSNMKENLIMTPDNAQAFARSLDMLDSSISEMRRVAHNMMPEVLVKYGLDTALNEFCKNIDRSGAVHINYQSLGMEHIELDQTTSITIYRIVQELVNNAIKHAAAKNVLVQLHIAHAEKLLTVTVEDDGKGFDTKTVLNKPAGIGWNNIQNRVEFLKGKLDVNSEMGKGTSVLIEIGV